MTMSTPPRTVPSPPSSAERAGVGRSRSRRQTSSGGQRMLLLRLALFASIFWNIVVTWRLMSLAPSPLDDATDEKAANAAAAAGVPSPRSMVGRGRNRKTTKSSVGATPPWVAKPGRGSIRKKAVLNLQPQAAASAGQMKDLKSLLQELKADRQEAERQQLQARKKQYAKMRKKEEPRKTTRKIIQTKSAANKGQTDDASSSTKNQTAAVTAAVVASAVSEKTQTKTQNKLRRSIFAGGVPSNNTQTKKSRKSILAGLKNATKTILLGDKKKKKSKAKEQQQLRKTSVKVKKRLSKLAANTNHTSAIPVDPSTSFGACLLVMDENHRLPEWLAYHYYMLPLRRVVLWVDPRSQSSPMPIVTQWRQYMDIEILSDHDIGLTQKTKGYLDDRRNNDTTATSLIRLHRTRQKLFFTSCLQHLRTKHQQQWVTVHNVDEYLYLEPSVIPNAVERMQKPGSVLQFLQDLQPFTPNDFLDAAASNPHAQSKVEQAFGAVNDQTTTTTTTTAQDRAQKLLRAYEGAVSHHCVMASRTLFGAVEHDDPSHVQEYVPTYLNGSNFETLRWHYRTSHDDVTNNGRGKSILQVSAPETLEWDDREPLFKSCAVGAGTTTTTASALQIRHYLGSWDAYTRRVHEAGHSRTSERYEYQSQFMGRRHHDAAVQQWLVGFCRQVSPTACQELLSRASPLVVERAETNTNPMMLWKMPAAQMQQAIHDDRNKTVPDSLPFGQWLERQYKLNTLADGTVTVSRKPEKQGFAPLPDHNHHRPRGDNNKGDDDDDDDESSKKKKKKKGKNKQKEAAEQSQ